MKYIQYLVSTFLMLFLFSSCDNGVELENQSKPATKPAIGQVATHENKFPDFDEKKSPNLSRKEMEGKTLAEITQEARRRQKEWNTYGTWQTDPQIYGIERNVWRFNLPPGASETMEGIKVTRSGRTTIIQSKEDPMWDGLVFTETGQSVSCNMISVMHLEDYTLFIKHGRTEAITDANRERWPEP